MDDHYKKTEKIDKSLSEVARDKRETAPRSSAKRGDRTTLNLSSPDENESSAPPPDALGEALVEKGLISRHQLFKALSESYSTDTTLREALIALGFIDEDVLDELKV